ncbi:hypothetical protein NMF36_20525, partial [Acinetobacter baumannii]
QNIYQATKLQPIAELVDQATQLNQSMDQLQQAVNEHANVEQTIDYTQADSDKQNAYKQAIADAENVLKQNANKQQVDQALQNILNAKQALNGNANVQHAKDEATALINSSNDLNQAQKDALKQQVQNATTVAGVNNVKQTAQELNNAMTQLKQGIADKEQTKADGNFVNADSDKQNAY